jgi:hypothetical protein
MLPRCRILKQWFQVRPPGWNGADKNNLKLQDAGEVQIPLNQKLSSKLLKAVNFVLRFIITIESTNFKFKFY